MRRTGRVVPRDSLLDTVWGDETDVALNTVDAFVSSLRRKLEEPGETRLIHTVRGIGFCIQESES